MIPLSRPDIAEDEVQAVVRTLRSGRLSLGPEIEAFEREFAEYIGTKEAVAVSSGTAGLHCVVRTLGIREGDEVITSPFSFIASANCILFERARPVFVDIEEERLSMDPAKIEEKITPKTKAILAVHILGIPCSMNALVALALEHELFLIEDTCEAIGAEWRGKKAGSFGAAGVFAFYPNKQMTTSEGGMIVTNHSKIADLCRSLRNQGRGIEEKDIFQRLGYNYRMSDIHAALGRVQLGKIERFLRKRRQVAQWYIDNFKDCQDITLPPQLDESQSWFVFVIRLSDRFTREDRDRLRLLLKKDGIETGAYFPPIHLQEFYQRRYGYKLGDFPITEKIADRTIALPFYNGLKREEVDHASERLLANLSLVPV